MRYLRLDQYEFDTQEGEQEIVFCQGGENQFKDAEAFFRATCALPGFVAGAGMPLPPCRYLREAPSGRFYNFLKRESDLSLGDDTEVHVIADDWDFFDVVVVEGYSFARLAWSTSA